MSWQPIETVPKNTYDGYVYLFLGYVPHEMGGYMSVFYWNERLQAFQNNTDGGTDKPSHWVHLPPPPQNTHEEDNTNAI